MIAWTLFSGESREGFRAALSVDDATWARGRGWALSWALILGGENEKCTQVVSGSNSLIYLLL